MDLFSIPVMILGIWPECVFLLSASRVFVRDGIHSVADYNSTLMAVVVVVVVVVVVRFFHDGITP